MMMKSLIRVFCGNLKAEYRELSRRDKDKLLEAQDDRVKLDGILREILNNNKRPLKTGFPAVDGYIYANTAGIQFNYNPRDN